ncbi:MAG: MerR family transcriptional regulator [Gammaproteobacteria bacterium]|nr:MerR family transcriptional regulator [Gammaproteobacteria bacterium]
MLKLNPVKPEIANDGETQDLTYTISELAKEFGITTRAIRFYEDEHLISPERIGRQRIYSGRDYTRLKLILRGKRLGFTLADIADMLNLYDSEPGEKAQLEVALVKARQRRQSLEQQLDDLKLTMTELDAFETSCREQLKNL